MCNLREGFVNLREGFVEAPWRLREAFSKTRSAKASRSPLEGFLKASRRRHGRLHLETVRQIRAHWMVVYDAEFGVVFLAKGPRTASIQAGLDCLGLNYSGLEGERYFRLIVELT